MKEHNYIKIGEHTEQTSKTTFIVNSFADMEASRTAEQLIMDMLKAKVRIFSEKKEVKSA